MFRRRFILHEGFPGFAFPGFRLEWPQRIDDRVKEQADLRLRRYGGQDVGLKKAVLSTAK